jgi:Predicted redox protein, regulator of disulfide bond formation
VRLHFGRIEERHPAVGQRCAAQVSGDVHWSAYRAYSRAHEISAQGKTAIAGSSNPVFRGDAARWNPAELLIAALSACHQLWYLHLCADAGIVVVAYSDDASGVEIEQADGAGQFESVTLRPHAKLAASRRAVRRPGSHLRAK